MSFLSRCAEVVRKLVVDVFTERDAVSWCWARVLGTVAAGAILQKFWQYQPHSGDDFANAVKAVAYAVCAIILGVAAKSMTDLDWRKE